MVVAFINDLIWSTWSQPVPEDTMPKVVTRLELFLKISLSLNGVSLQTRNIPKEGLFQVLSRLLQPASLELWTDQSCEMHFDLRLITTILKEQNTAFINHIDITVAGISPNITRVSLRKLPGYLHCYAMIATFLLGDDASELEFFQCLFQRVDFILCTSFMFQVTSAREVWRSTLQLISAPEKKFTLFDKRGLAS